MGHVTFAYSRFPQRWWEMVPTVKVGALLIIEWQTDCVGQLCRTIITCTPPGITCTTPVPPATSHLPDDIKEIDFNEDNRRGQAQVQKCPGGIFIH